ncbi:ATP-dependent dethiobiotin synthetase BioD [Kocuria sp.]|uniref:ATP-dependent dethiobiotin synthetase BioD n=1 Tax=Kocuria sp. TaxID=1871328 RepID=UPI0026DB9746|nr:ATP-dependent dethiobiotin synthetase BioD [Kocuria sp.]MDO4918101.1 ATP-dependent dethiobiotin synthetase BioD [Kocuria sp.]
MNDPLSGNFTTLGRTVLVTGTDTDVGKTYATAALAVAGWHAGRRRIAVYKPQQTGMRGDDPGDVHDVARLVRAAGVPPEVLTVAEGQRLTEPMAPPPAAALDGVELLPLTTHVAKILELQESHDLVLVEGSGGVLVELDGDRRTIADLAVALQGVAPQETVDRGPTTQGPDPVGRADAREERASVPTAAGPAPVSTVLVARPDLGTLNHTLLSLEALLHRGVHVAGVVLGSWPAEPDRLQETNREYLADLPEILGRRIPLLGAVPLGWGAEVG